MARSVLDEPSALAAPGARTMLSLTGVLGNQLGEGFELGRSAPGLPSAEGLRAVVLCGMGGSGIAGDVLRALYLDRLGVPVVGVKGHVLPEFCGRDTLVLASSFSGHTEETVAVYNEAVARECRTVAVSSDMENDAVSRGDGPERRPDHKMRALLRHDLRRDLARTQPKPLVHFIGQGDKHAPGWWCVEMFSVR